MFGHTSWEEIHRFGAEFSLESGREVVAHRRAHAGDLSRQLLGQCNLVAAPDDLKIFHKKADLLQIISTIYI